ncbi:MAG: acetyl-CoA carboxylase biotin carboxyl carrier protein [Gemmatimonadaceae bacterium]
MIDLRYVKKLVEMLDASSVDSIEISSDKGMKIRISKTPMQRGAVQVAAPVSLPVQTAERRLTPEAGSPGLNEAESAQKLPKAPRPDLIEVKSPMVGTYYGRPEPGAKPYVAVGSQVSKGQILCIIEAMKIMNEIESEFTGIVQEVCVQDAHPVEYGQALFRIDPNG